jgi:hypothetical protein
MFDVQPVLFGELNVFVDIAGRVDHADFARLFIAQHI